MIDNPDRRIDLSPLFGGSNEWEKIQHQFTAEMVIPILREGHYPMRRFRLSSSEGTPDADFENQKEQLLAKAAKFLSPSLFARRVREQFQIEHIKDVVNKEEEAVYTAIPISKNIMESETFQAPVGLDDEAFRIYDPAFRYGCGAIDQIVFSRSGIMGDHKKMNLAFFRVKFNASKGGREQWFEYDKQGNIRPCQGEIMTHPTDEEPIIGSGDSLVFIPLSPDSKEAAKLLGEHTDLAALRKGMVGDNPHARVDMPAFPLGSVSWGAVFRIQSTSGSVYRWTYYPPERFMPQFTRQADQQSLLRRVQDWLRSSAEHLGIL